jgi:hypothetical protein
MEFKAMLQARLSRLMVATQESAGKHDMKVSSKDG